MADPKFSIDLDFEALAQNQEKLAEISTLANVKDILDEAEALLLNRIRTRFLNTEDPDGKKWPESEAAAERKAHGRGGKTLFDTGTLWHSIQAYRERFDIRGIGTDVPYGPVHQLGLGHQEKRVFLGFGQDDITVVEARLLQRIEEVLT